MQDKCKTVGQLSVEAAKDTSSYCAFDVADEMTKDIEGQVWECIGLHKEQFDVPQFCVVMLLAKDNVIHNLMRRKFYAWPFLPKPRTSQTVWLYDSRDGSVRMLWCLPAADTMATLTGVPYVHRAYSNMQRWAGYFYTTEFWQLIREEHDIEMLSEEEHLEVIREKGPQPGLEDNGPTPTNPIDAIKFHTQQIAHT